MSKTAAPPTRDAERHTGQSHDFHVFFPERGGIVGRSIFNGSSDCVDASIGMSPKRLADVPYLVGRVPAAEAERVGPVRKIVET